MLALRRGKIADFRGISRVWNDGSENNRFTEAAGDEEVNSVDRTSHCITGWELLDLKSESDQLN